MKGKKLWAILLTICLVVGSIGVTSVMASAEKDIDVSITTDKSVLKAGDVVTVSVNLDRFESTIKDDTRKMITTMEFYVPFDTDVFEYVKGSMVNGIIFAVDEEGDFSDANIVAGEGLRVAAVYKNTALGATKETTTTIPFLTFQLKVKDTVKSDLSASFNMERVTLRNLYLEDSYTYNVTPANVKVYTEPVIQVNGSETIAESYTKAVEISATQGAKLTVNGEEQTNPCTVSASGDYTVVATNVAGLETTKTFKIAPVVDKIEVTTLPNVVEYVKGTALDLTGGKLKATMSNGETKEVAMTDAAVKAEGYNATPDTFGVQTVTVTYEGKSATFEVKVKDKEVTGIVWETDPATSVIEGQGLAVALKDAKITASYDDGTSDSVAVTDQMCSGFKDEVGTHKVTVTYGGKELTFDIEVKEKQLTKVDWKKTPDKTEYIEGTELDVTGAVITVSYDNGNTEEKAVTADMVTGFGKETIGEQTLTVTYTEKGVSKTVTFKVTVKKKSLAEISIESAPSNTTVKEGQKLDVTGGTVKVVYDNGTSKVVDLTADMVSGFDNTKIGEQEVTVTFVEGNVSKTTTFQVTVVEKAVEAIVLTSAPTNLTVLEGKEIDFAGATLKVVYDNGTEDFNVALTKDMISGFDNRKIGEQNITVCYAGKELKDAFTVTVIEKSVKNVEITKNDVTEVKEGKVLTFAGELTVTYDNGDVETVAFTSDAVKVDTSAVDTTKPGTYKVSLAYTDKKNETHTLSYDVVVVEKVLEKIEITTKPSKTSIVEGTKLDVTDGVITLYYDNDTTATVAMTNDMISGFDNAKIGNQTVTVTYAGKTTELEVTVAAKSVAEVTLVSAPTATTVTEGLELDLAGGKIHVVYDNGTEEDMNISAGMLTLDNKTVGKQTATVTYGGKTVTFEVEVLAKVATGLDLNFGEVTDVTEGTTLKDAGLEISLVYNNNTKDVLTFDDVTVEGYDENKIGQQVVKVTYQKEETVFVTEFTVRVLKKTEIKSDVKVDVPGINSDDVYLNIVKEIATEVIAKVETALESVVEKESLILHKVFDIKLLDKATGDVIEKPNGNVTIKMEIPEGFNIANKLTVYRVEEDGTMTKLDTKVDKTTNKVEFTTNHFSTYVLVEEKAEVETPGTEKDTTTGTEETSTGSQETTTAKTEQTQTTTSGSSVATGDVVNVAAILTVVVAAGIGFVVSSRKKLSR